MDGPKNSALFLKLAIPIGQSEETKKIVKDYKASKKEIKDKKKEAKKLKNAEN